MKVITTLTIDCEVETPQRLSLFFFTIPWFSKQEYVKAVFEGEIEIEDLDAKEHLRLFVYNDKYPTEFRVRGISCTPKQQNDISCIELYKRGSNRAVDGRGTVHFHTIEDVKQWISGPITERLERQGLFIKGEVSVSNRPSYFSIHSSLSTPDYMPMGKTAYS